MSARHSTIKTTWRLAVCVAVVLGGTMVSANIAVADPTPPPNPTNAQLGSARSAKSALAAQVGQLGGRIALAQSRIRELDGAAQLAEQKLALALQRQQQARDAALAAKAGVGRARAQVARAHRDFVTYLQASYMSGDVGGDLAGLLTAPDPNTLLQQSILQDYEASHRVDAVGRLTQATVAKSNSDAVARQAAQERAKAAQRAGAAQQEVVATLAAAKSQKSALNDQLNGQRRSLQAVQIKLTGLTDQRGAYRAWQAEQARRAAREAQQRRQQRLAQQQAAAANAARQPTGHRSGGRSAASTAPRRSGGGSSAPAPTPSGGSWTAAKGRRAVSRVMGYVGTPYSWAAGNASGPTYGVSEPGAAWNDSNILGFDCSGLTIYAWAPWLSMDHFAATQYTQAGNYHPSLNNLMPGDLVFWSGNGAIGGIGHEAMYIGNGNVIQAPQSGDVIKITNVYNVESGYFGATRPLT